MKVKIGQLEDLTAPMAMAERYSNGYYKSCQVAFERQLIILTCNVIRVLFAFLFSVVKMKIEALIPCAASGACGVFQDWPATCQTTILGWRHLAPGQLFSTQLILTFRQIKMY